MFWALGHLYLQQGHIVAIHTVSPQVYIYYVYISLQVEGMVKYPDFVALLFTCYKLPESPNLHTNDNTKI